MKINKQYTTTTVDYETGEIKNESTDSVYSFPSEPPFVKLYLADIEKLFNLPLNASDLIYALLRYMNYDGDMIIVSDQKKDIAEKFNCSLSHINNQITLLTKRDILIRKGRSRYMLNPHLFAKGQWNDIKRLRDSYFELKIKYSPTGNRVISSGTCEE